MRVGARHTRKETEGAAEGNLMSVGKDGDRGKRPSGSKSQRGKKKIGKNQGEKKKANTAKASVEAKVKGTLARSNRKRLA